MDIRKRDNMILINELANRIHARLNCIENKNAIWIMNHEEAICNIEENFLPHGAGIDNGCHIDLEKSTGEKIIIDTSFHHMNENGMYDGWTEHTIIVKASLVYGINISISGSNRNDIKEYLHELFYNALKSSITEV